MATLHFVIVAVAFIWSIASAQEEFNITCTTGRYPPNSTTRVNENYVINLDQQPIDRWAELAKAKKEQLASLIADLKYVFNGTDFGTKINEIERDGAKLVGLLPSPFADEIRGISEASGLNPGDALIINLSYELSSYCTSIIAEDVTGSLLHARNLDYDWTGLKGKHGYVTESLRHLVVNLDWQRGGKTVFKSVNFAGYAGVLTAVKPNTFTLSINTRFENSTHLDAIEQWFKGPDRSKAWLGFLTRSVLENATSYSQAKDLLEITKMVAPAYFILGGNKSGEGVVISRSSESNIDTWSLKNASNWYIVQTNQDRWDDSEFDTIRNVSDTCMGRMGQNNVGYPGVFNVLSSMQVLKSESVYTSLMRVNTGEIESYIRNCSSPCLVPVHT